jgi:arginine deiminase
MFYEGASSKWCTAAIYNWHPCSPTPTSGSWYPDQTRGPDSSRKMGAGVARGGDVMPIGNRTVLVGIGERTTGRWWSAWRSRFSGTRPSIA